MISPAGPWPKPPAIDMRRRLSFEALARFHRAVVGNGITTEQRLTARGETTVAEVEGLNFGPTFADTLALNRRALDLFEEGTP